MTVPDCRTRPGPQVRRGGRFPAARGIVEQTVLCTDLLVCRQLLCSVRMTRAPTECWTLELPSGVKQMVLPAWSLSSMGEAASWGSLTAAAHQRDGSPRP